MMKTPSAQPILLPTVMLLYLSATSAITQDAVMNDMTMVNLSTLKWVDAPSDLPKDVKLAMLYGDPGRNGPYVVRLKTPGGYKVPSHWYTETENLMMILGTPHLDNDDTVDMGAAHVLKANGFHNLPGDMHYYTFTRTAAVAQIYGTGLLDIKYVNPQDNPSPKQ